MAFIPDVTMSDGSVFRMIMTGTTTPEIYGWLEKDHCLISGSAGWWRTTDPQEAAKRAAANFGLEIKS